LVTTTSTWTATASATTTRSTSSAIPSTTSFEVTSSHPPAHGVPRAINREIGDAVLTGKFDAGAMHLRRYYLDKDKPPGLTLMGSFSATPKIFVARSGLDTSVIAEFRKALVGLDRQQGDGQEQEPATCELDEPFTGAVAIDDSYFGALREALRKAARFDGLPDPFPTNPTPPTGGR